jgi:hypothetical protein
MTAIAAKKIFFRAPASRGGIATWQSGVLVLAGVELKWNNARRARWFHQMLYWRYFAAAARNAW